MGPGGGDTLGWLWNRGGQCGGRESRIGVRGGTRAGGITLGCSSGEKVSRGFWGFGEMEV